MVTRIPKNIKFSMYVSDLALYITGMSLLHLERQFHLAIQSVLKWSDSHGFHFSISKTKAVLSASSGKRGFCHLHPPNLVLYGSPIPVDTRVLFLGFILDENLTYSLQRFFKTTCHNTLDLLHYLTSKTRGTVPNRFCASIIPSSEQSCIMAA